MESKVCYFLLLAMSLQLAYCQSSISCYDCDPLNFASDCGDPVGNAVRSSPCTIDPDVINGTAICLSAFLNVTGPSNQTLTGIYRGCRTLGPAVSDFCDWFREERQGFNTTVVSCEACNTTRCNINKFNSDGSNGSENVVTVGAVALVVNALLVILLNAK